MTLPNARVGCELLKLVRNTFGAHRPRVAAWTPALGIRLRTPVSRATFWMPICTPECTVPTMTSTLSRCTSLLAFSIPLDGSDSSSTLKYSISRPPSLPPCSLMAMRKPFSIATPSWAKVPVYGSMKPTRTLAACARTSSGSNKALEAAPTMVAVRVKTRRREVIKKLLV